VAEFYLSGFGIGTDEGVEQNPMFVIMHFETRMTVINDFHKKTVDFSEDKKTSGPQGPKVTRNSVGLLNSFTMYQS
jgi:hypothetical protein